VGLVLERAGVEAGDAVAGGRRLGEEALAEGEAEVVALVLGGDEHPLHLAGAAAEVAEGDAAGRLSADAGEEEAAGGPGELAGSAASSAS
jgi:hypothetical protein